MEETDFVIYRGSKVCNWSIKAFDKLMAAGCLVRIAAITDDEIKMLQEDFNVDCLPIIFHHEHCIGSYDNLMEVLTQEIEEK